MIDFIVCTTQDDRNRRQFCTKIQRVWLPQRERAKLFAVSSDKISLHLKNIYRDGKLSCVATSEESSVVQTEGSREVQRPVMLSNLDAILAVGYRMRSPRDVQLFWWGLCPDTEPA